MAMGSNGQRGLASDINVTPLIDVLLVLLIVFMVIVPVTPKGLTALLPQPAKSTGAIADYPETIVVQVANGAHGGAPVYKINQTAIGGKPELLSALTAIFATRAERVMFVKGGNDVEFSTVAEVIDLGHSAGVDRVGLITPKSPEVQ